MVICVSKIVVVIDFADVAACFAVVDGAASVVVVVVVRPTVVVASRTFVVVTSTIAGCTDAVGCSVM